MLLKKQKRHAFGKDIFLLGQDASGQNYWLEAPSWDCNWYWGFGYIETYTNNRSPGNSKDIFSHSHADNFISEYFTEWNNSKPILAKQTFDETEGWELSELFKQFYFLKDAAAHFATGNCNFAATSVKSWAKPELVTEINTTILPQIMNRILAILTPVEGK